jgi:hypothetical protein
MRSGTSKAAVVCLPFALLAVPCFAESIIINGDPPVNFTIVTSTSFNFGSDSSGGGDFGFTNETGQTWTTLDVIVTVASFEPITCGSVAFVTCTVIPLTPVNQSPVTFDIMFGPNPSAGITNLENFTINLNENGNQNTDPNGAGGWTPGREFAAVANAPEPGTLVLGVLGVLFLAIYSLPRLALGSKRFSKAAN